jgi:hypothetical protein
VRGSILVFDRDLWDTYPVVVALTNINMVFKVFPFREKV